MAETEQSNVDYSNLIRAQTRQVDIDAFKERGMKKVNVINARKINELILIVSKLSREGNLNP